MINVIQVTLEACGYGRNEIDIIDNLVQRYIDGDDVDTETIVNQPEEHDEIIEEETSRLYTC